MRSQHVQGERDGVDAVSTAAARGAARPRPAAWPEPHPLSSKLGAQGGPCLPAPQDVARDGFMWEGFAHGAQCGLRLLGGTRAVTVQPHRANAPLL